MSKLIACLCPTYKRPEYLRNSIACFVSQSYVNKVLVVLDDAGQHAAHDCPDEGWRLISESVRYPNLPAKLNALAALVPDADILVVWEDDDIYLPHHLAAIAEAAAVTSEAAFFAPTRVLSNYNVPSGQTREEDATGRFHGSWAYTRGLWNLLDGYAVEDRLDFDQHMGSRCRAAVGVTDYVETDTIRRFGPSYIYRWGNGAYNASEGGEEGYANLWQRLADLPFDRIERTGPRMDDETHSLYSLHGWAIRDATSGRGWVHDRRQSICLVMLVRNESAIIERCLASVRDFIDTWLIIDTGSDDDTVARAQQMLSGVSGQLLQRPWRDFSGNRNELLELARERAEFSLWIDADETLIVDGVAPWDGLTGSVYGIGVQTTRGTFLQPRLLHRDANVHFVGAIAETLAGADRLQPLDRVVIRHHEDGVRWRDPVRIARDILLLETALLDDPTNPEFTLALAQRHNARGAWSTAFKYYQRRLELGGGAAQIWFALYQSARMLDEQDFADPAVIGAYFAAYDFRPTKAEPLVRIAQRCLRAGRNDVAADVAWTAIETPFEDRDCFFEPDAYNSQRHLVYLRAKLELGHCADAIEHIERLVTRKHNAPEFLQELDELRALARRRESAASPPDVIPVTVPSLPFSDVSRRAIPDATPRRERRKLCIGMATFDDYDGVYFSVQAIRMFHPEVKDHIELLVIDNNPRGPSAEGLKNLDAWCSNYRYVPEAELRGTAVRDLIFREANADYVLVMDSHVLIVPGALRRLLEYFEANPDCADLLQGPMLYDDMHNLSTHFEPVWREGMYGIWQTDPRGEDPEAAPFEIPMQGLGVFACRREAWPGFNPRFRGFGGEEGYIHEKFRQAGGKTLCLPFLRWLHRFHRPRGTPYAPNWYDRVRNYTIGHAELGLDSAPIEAHFSELLGAQETATYMARIDREMQSPLYGFDGIYYCGESDTVPLDQSAAREGFERLGVLDRVVVVAPIRSEAADAPHSRALERVLSHRSIIARAKRRGLQSVLIVDNVNDLAGAIVNAGEARVKALHSREWGVFRFSPSLSAEDSSEDCATAYHASIFDSLLEHVPERPESARRWMSTMDGAFVHLKVNRSLERHRRNMGTCSDINEHLDTLRRYAGCSSHVTEMGVRDAVSTWSLLAGKPGKLVSYDVYRSPGIGEVEDAAEVCGVEFEFIQANVLEVEIEQTDLLFIDTVHTYEQLKAELTRHGDKARKYILLHDTVAYGDTGENGKRPGLTAAVEEFVARNPEWIIAERFSNNNGLTCLVRSANVR